MECVQDSEKKMQKSVLAAKKIHNAQIYKQHQLRRNRSLNTRNKKYLNVSELKKTESCGNLTPDDAEDKRWATITIVMRKTKVTLFFRAVNPTS